MDRPVTARPVAATARPGWVKPAALVLTGLLVVALALLGWFGGQALGGLGEEWGRSNALDAATDAATSLTTFNAAQAQQDTDRFLDATSTDFSRSFAGDRAGFVTSLQQGQVMMTGQVRGAGVEDYDGDTAHVFVAVRAQVTSTQAPQPQARDYRMEFTMVDQGGWKVDRIEFIA